MGPSSAMSSWGMLRSIQNSERVTQHRLTAAEDVAVDLVQVEQHDREVALHVLLLVDREGDLLTAVQLGLHDVDRASASFRGATVAVAAEAFDDGGLRLREPFTETITRAVVRRLAGVHIQRRPPTSAATPLPTGSPSRWT